MQRSVRITPARHNPTCSAAIYLQGPAGTQVNVEVIDPSTWNYLAVKTVTLSGNGYADYGTPTWKSTIDPVVFRVSLLANGDSWVRADDLGVTCSGYYAS